MTRDLTTLLHDWSEGDAAALSELMPLVYGHLQRQARGLLRQRGDGTLQPTAVVHEAFLELIDQRRVSIENRRHFFGLAAYLMRRIVAASERRRRRAKRGGEMERTTLSTGLAERSAPGLDVLAVHEALERLERLAPRQARLIEQRFFAGYSLEECAEILGISLATANRDWRLARAWLQAELTVSSP